MFKSLFSLICFILLACTIAAQRADKTLAIEELTKVANQYKKSSRLSFDVAYKYAHSQQPGQYLDSLKGQFKINGNQYWYTMENTECIGDESLMLMLFKEDEVMFIATPVASLAGGSPVLLLDSFLRHSDDISCEIRKTKQKTELKLDFAPGSPYKSITYEIDPATYYIIRMTCLVQASALYDPTVQGLMDNSDTYAIVDVVFDNYRLNSFDAQSILTNRYFKKEGDEYIALAPFDNYKIFLGSSKL